MSPISKNIFSRAFTLVEVIIYASIATLLLLVIVEMTITLAHSSERSNIYEDINSTAVAAFGRFSRDIRRATAVDTLSSTFDSSSGKLVLQMKKPDGTNDVTAMYLADNKIKEDFNGLYIGDITPNIISISNLTFRLLKVASTTAIRIEMTAVPQKDVGVPAFNFYSTYVVRGSYIQ